MSQKPNIALVEFHKKNIHICCHAIIFLPDLSNLEYEGCMNHGCILGWYEYDGDEDDLDDEEPRLYEVNDDELFLAYDSGGVVAPRRHAVNSRRTPTRGSGAGSTSSTQSGSKLEALDNLVISTIFSVSTKLCLLSGKLVKSVQERTSDKEEEAMLQTLVSH